jgi:hypothetical protein
MYSNANLKRTLINFKIVIPKLTTSLYVCFESHEQFFSYLTSITMAGDRASNLDLCLALAAFSSKGSFTCHTYYETGPLSLRSYRKDP